MDLNKLVRPNLIGVSERGGWPLNVYPKECRLIIFAVAFFLMAAGSFSYYPGSAIVLLFFQAVFLLMFLMAWVRPFVDSYFFLALFLFLGFCLKFNVHLFVEYSFVEPVGDFEGDPAHLDQALIGAAVAALGVVVFRGIQFFQYYFNHSNQVVADEVVPGWYLRFPGSVWGALILFFVILYVVNYFFAFFQTGVNSRLALPFGLGAALAWLCYCGAIVAFYLVLGWESARKKDRTWPILWPLCLLGILVSASLLSRATMILLFLSFVVTLIFHKKYLFLKIWNAWRWKALVLPLASLFISLFLVSWLRLNTYNYEYSGVATVQTSGHDSAGQVGRPLPQVGMTPRLMFIEVMRLGVDRWVGLEGMLVFAASDARGLPMLVNILSESPSEGTNSIYQKLSSSPYEFMEEFTYLTLPGAPALLFSSGSLWITFGGMFLLVALLSFFERFTFWASRSRFVTSWVAVLMANAVCQMSFPYLWGVFVVVSFLALCFVALITRNVPGEH